jgi:tRNA (guanine37-N1)-methyltransferase
MSPQLLPWNACVLTLFPEMFPGMLGHSLVGRALDEGRWSLDTIQIRDFATDKHNTVDDTPCGGGAGMVMRPDVVSGALDEATKRFPLAKKVFLTPKGKRLTQEKVRELADAPGVILLCGRYEGVDQRVLDEHDDIEEISIGDYVLNGGESAATVLLEACVRLLPGVIGKEASHEDESFEAGLLEYPHYTRPREWQGRSVPEVLLSGHHEKILAWRKSQAQRITQERRPDLWDAYCAETKGSA